ncbi:hypothetical protein AGOR_G00029820 [Albula goreensis]|uniref:legumain n=1 Tax=Albula goreensis TaxID=1534307 RepID=A0A8T3E4V6_9TELE|nr:hypothetical protein AGOR_G00029820 [Albula goreensis]
MGGASSKQCKVMDLGYSIDCFRKEWILLAAGSRGWDNYRHQADVCHAYQMAKTNGIPDEQIIVMMYDDIAYNEENPVQGNIINEPNGMNVYNGVPKDYTGNEVSADNFLAVLSGDEASVTKRGPKKVIKSGSYDTIFVYLSDHGSIGMFSFPRSTLYAADLIDTVTKMSSNKQFSKMVIYMESCHSGSMLNQLPKNINVYGVSASTPGESSYACYEDKRRNAFLADAFTAAWLCHNKNSDLDSTTFQDQFNFISKKVTTSTPCQYGDMEMRKGIISDFWGNDAPGDEEQPRAFELTDAIPSYNVSLRIQENRIRNERDPRKREELRRRHEHLRQTRAKIEVVVQQIACGSCPRRGPRCLTERKAPTRLRELKAVAEHFRTTCFDWHEEEFECALSQMHVFVNLCESGVQVASITQAITRVSRIQRGHVHH